MEDQQSKLKTNKKPLVIGLGIVIVVIAIASSILLRLDIGFSSSTDQVVQTSQERIIYQGKEGVDALTLLKENAEVIEENGFVQSINGYQASEEGQEYWAFYLNGQLSQIGANQYITKDGDEIVWKIENY